MDTNKKGRLWFCSDYGIENKSIIKILSQNEEKYYIVTHDKEAKWGNITPLFQRKIVKESLKGNIVYGIGLNGTIPEANINNLDLSKGEDGKPISALEQVTRIIGIKMNLDEQFISAYAKYGIDGIKQTAMRLKISENGAEEIVTNILIRDHQAKGISLEQEAKFIRKINVSNQRQNSVYETIIDINNMLNLHHEERAIN